MENLKKIISDYCSKFVTTNHDARMFMCYYEPNFYDVFSDHIEDKESFDYLAFIDNFLSYDDSMLEKIRDDLMEFYFNHKPY